MNTTSASGSTGLLGSPSSAPACSRLAAPPAQASLLMLEITRRRSGILADVGSLDRLQKLGRWITVDPNRWAAGFIVADEQGREPV